MSTTDTPDWTVRLATVLRSSDKSVDDLYGIIGLDAQSNWLKDALDGRRPPSIDNYSVLSAILDIPLRVLTGEIAIDRSFAVALRAGRLDLATDLQRIAERAAIALDVLDVLLSWFPQERLDALNRLDEAKRAKTATTFMKSAGVKTAQKFRDIFGLGSEPIGDLSSLVEKLGIPVFIEEMPQSLHGITVKDDAGIVPESIIIVNSRDWWGRQRFTLAHELCHVLYGDVRPLSVNRDSFTSNALEEVRADNFARQLLAPSEHAAVYWRDAVKRSKGQYGDALADFMMYFGLSRDASIVAISQDVPSHIEKLEPYRQVAVTELMRAVGRGTEWDTACAEQSEPSASGWMLSMALSALENELVPPDFVARVLGRDDVEQVRVELASNGWAA